MKVIFYLIFVLTFILLPTKQLFASSATAYQDYIYQFDQYRLALNNFTVAKGEYMQYQTLLSQTTALDTVKTMMAARTQLFRAYLSFLNEKFNENKGLTVSDKEVYQRLLQNEMTFLQAHQQKISSINSISDATDISGQLQTHMPTLGITMRKSIVELSLGNMMAHNKIYKSLFDALLSITDSNKPKVTPEKQAIIDRWLVQINSKQSLFLQKTEAIITANNAIKGTADRDLDDQLRTIQKDLLDAKQYLVDGTGYIQELITLLGYQD